MSNSIESNNHSHLPKEDWSPDFDTCNQMICILRRLQRSTEPQAEAAEHIDKLKCKQMNSLGNTIAHSSRESLCIGMEIEMLIREADQIDQRTSQYRNPNQSSDVAKILQRWYEWYQGVLSCNRGLAISLAGIKGVEFFQGITGSSPTKNTNEAEVRTELENFIQDLREFHIQDVDGQALTRVMEELYKAVKQHASTGKGLLRKPMERRPTEERVEEGKEIKRKTKEGTTGEGEAREERTGEGKGCSPNAPDAYPAEDRGRGKSKSKSTSSRQPSPSVGSAARPVRNTDDKTKDGKGIKAGEIPHKVGSEPDSKPSGSKLSLHVQAGRDKFTRVVSHVSSLKASSNKWTRSRHANSRRSSNSFRVSKSTGTKGSTHSNPSTPRASNNVGAIPGAPHTVSTSPVRDWNWVLYQAAAIGERLVAHIRTVTAVFRQITQMMYSDCLEINANFADYLPQYNKDQVPRSAEAERMIYWTNLYSNTLKPGLIKFGIEVALDLEDTSNLALGPQVSRSGSLAEYEGFPIDWSTPPVDHMNIGSTFVHIGYSESPTCDLETSFSHQPGVQAGHPVA